MTTGNIGKIKASRVNNVPNVSSYIGEKGILFYNYANGVIRMSDGITPGGVPIPYNIATGTTIGGIKAGPGANISVDGTLSIDTSGLPLSIGNLQINDTTISTLTPNADLNLITNGTGSINVAGNLDIHTTSQGVNGPTVLRVNQDGQIFIYVPNVDPYAGAVRIVGTASGNVYPPQNSGVMLHAVGQNGDSSRIYNDGIGGFAAFVGRRINGTVSVPSTTLANDVIMRISAVGFAGAAGMPQFGSSRIAFVAEENYTATAQGGRLEFWVNKIGANALSNIATVDGTGLTVRGNITAGNIIANTNGNISGTVGTFTGNLTANTITSFVNLTAGTTTTPTIKFANGALLTTATSGAIEYDGNVFYGTPNDAQRGIIPTQQWFVLNSNRTTTFNTTVAQSLFGVSPVVTSSTRYHFVIRAIIDRTTGDNNTTLNLAWDGNANIAGLYYTAQSRISTMGTVSSENSVTYAINSNFGANSAITAVSNPPSTTMILIEGIADINNGGGTLTPLITWSGATAAGVVTVRSGARMHINPLGPIGANTSIGNWA